MKDDGVNRDTTIEVGDLVRVVSDYMHDPHGFMGNDYIVESIGEDDGAIWLTANDGVEWWFDPEELEIMQPKAALKSVYAEKDSIRHKHLLAYELCEKMHEGYIEYDYLQQELQRIFDDRSGEED